MPDLEVTGNLTVVGQINTDTNLSLKSRVALSDLSDGFLRLNQSNNYASGVFVKTRLSLEGWASLGNTGVNYSPTVTTWNAGGATLLLNGLNETSIAFHDSGLRVDAIVAGAGRITVGKDIGYGTAQVYAPGGMRGRVEGDNDWSILDDNNAGVIRVNPNGSFSWVEVTKDLRLRTTSANNVLLFNTNRSVASIECLDANLGGYRRLDLISANFRVDNNLSVSNGVSREVRIHAGAGSGEMELESRNPVGGALLPLNSIASQHKWHDGAGIVARTFSQSLMGLRGVFGDVSNTGTAYGLSALKSDGNHFAVFTGGYAQLVLTVTGTTPWVTQAWSVGSDERLKENIRPAPAMLERVRQIALRQYRRIGAEKDAPDEYGVLAQEVASLFPDTVTEADAADGLDENGQVKYVKRLAVKYDHLFLAGLGATQELAALLDTANGRIASLEARLTALEAKRA